jgi:methylmalonyl-CoA mutase N-terminal domain/subunit
VGVNKWQKAQDVEPRIPRVDTEALAERQKERLAEWRARRDGDRTAASLGRLAEAARGSENLLPLIRGASAAGATVGEIADVLRAEFGTYSDPAGIGG